ncbi:CU044_5270 family protein [Actinomadura graeca]|uniref:CU044_5270 family protein n=1 Tax=Actinomadura graeca TaxID=2750812 RepID=A0ABX8R2F6_9ACTN|nr:CU044_5270 family protein [Actinomadura graeca]QXJ23183.1 CU044_5270 family protein [Actinomadura graeca]
MNDLAPPPRRDLPAGRHEARRAHLAGELAAARRPRGLPFRFSGRRLVFGGVTAAGLAAAVTAVLLVPGDGKERGPVVMNAAATEVLNRASRAAAARPGLHPRPDQFLYFESRDYQAAEMGSGGLERPQSGHRRAWFSVDGSRAGLIRNSGDEGIWLCEGSGELAKREAAASAEGREPPIDLAHPPTGCRNDDVRLTGMPDNVEAMRRWLFDHRNGQNPPAVQAFITVGDTIRERYVQPRTLSVIFAAAARIPGVTVTRGVTDLLGRKGIAVGQTWQGHRQELIFDAATYAFLGERTLVDGQGAPPPGATASPGTGDGGGTGAQGSVVYASAEVRMAVTDRAGQIPR